MSVKGDGENPPSQLHIHRETATIYKVTANMLLVDKRQEE